MKEQAARQQGAALQKGAATEDRQEKTTAQAAASAKYREDGVPQQELEQQIPHHGGALGLDDALQLGA